MFERRLKILLGLLVLVMLGLAVRAAQVQVFQRQTWAERATATMKREELTETTRGTIVDFKNRVLAVDAPCVDACVDFRAIQTVPDEKWVLELARKRLRERMGDGYIKAPREKQIALRDREVKQVKDDIEAMWADLAVAGHQPIEEVHATREAIILKVEMLRKFLWQSRYESARRKFNERQNSEPSDWRSFFLSEEEKAPQLEEFEEDVKEQSQPHVIIKHLSPEALVQLGKKLDKYPGLVLKPSTFRSYPYREAGCHLLGRLSRVGSDDLRNDPNLGVDRLRQYLPNDLIGRTGLEALCEPVLRGSRGRIERIDGDEVGRAEPVGGRTVRSTIDIELQRHLQRIFTAVQIKDDKENVIETVPMHGSAVIIDIRTGGVRALASYPDYDLNAFDEQYAQLSDSTNLDTPLLNRATQSQLEPGSTVKPIVGIGAIADHLLTATTGIECTGYLIIDGKKLTNMHRCWIAKMYEHLNIDVSHHQHPVPHVGHDGNPDGFLTLDDALERSCNVYFQTVGDMLKNAGLAKWFGHFGLGRGTGIGIAEAHGRVPSTGPHRARSESWSAGMGQGTVLATPLQMANVSATIARDGLWVRPTLIDDGMRADEAGKVIGGTHPASLPASLDLQLPHDAVEAAKKGMVRVVNVPGGTAPRLRREDVKIAGKTGTAQAAPISLPRIGPDGKPLRDPTGKVIRDYLTPSTLGQPNPKAPWYRGWGAEGKDVRHGWFIGYAPADNPQIAFAVMLEYGGDSGAGPTAAGVVKQVIQACVDHGYLPVDALVALSNDPQ